MTIYEAAERLRQDVVDYNESVGEVRNEQEIIKDVAVILTERPQLLAEVERLRNRVLSAAGDDLCRLSQEEIKDLTAGVVQIPPRETFLESCGRFHTQIAADAGELQGCLTLAQMIAENEKLRAEVERLKAELEKSYPYVDEIIGDLCADVDVQAFVREEEIKEAKAAAFDWLVENDCWVRKCEDIYYVSGIFGRFYTTPVKAVEDAKRRSEG